MNKKRIWFFGDSWVCTYTGWIKELVEKYDLDVKNYGVAGASIPHLLADISSKIDRIKPDDTVVICYTTTTRHFLNSKNFCAGRLAADETKEGVSAALEYHKITEPEYLAYKELCKTTGTEDLSQLNLFALKSLHNNIGKLLPKRTVELFGFTPTAPPVKDKIDLLSINYDFEKYPPLFDFITSNNIDYTESVIHIPDSYTEKFLQTYGTLFNFD